MSPPWEGSMRVPAMVRWPGKVPAGVVTEEMLSAHDWYKTFAALAGASDKEPTDRPMDGIDASKFLLGENEHTGRETILFFGPDGRLMSSKWRNVKAVLRYCEGIDKPIVEPQFPMFFDLGSDPGELYNLFDRQLDMGWMFGVTLQAIGEYRASIAKYPNIEPSSEFDGYPAEGSDASDGQ
jgi:arylsulfatase A-like enzyme